MRYKRWASAVLGLLVAATGGTAELHQHLVGGAALVVLGLVVWVVGSGSAVVDEASWVANRGRRRPFQVLGRSGPSDAS
jgi:hypothetical protein